MTGRVVLHVGLPKTGTTYLQQLLAAHAEPLLAGAVMVTSTGPGSAFRGAVEVRGSRGKFGLRAGAVAGVWTGLCALARAHAADGGVALLGHEVLAGAPPWQVTQALQPLAGVPVDVVVTARDLGRQATGHWQEEVKLGDQRSFVAFEAEELRGDTGPDDGPDAGGTRPRFWHAQDWADALARWGTGLPPEHGHLVVGPRPGSEPAELWRRFADACGLDPGLVDTSAAGVANPSLGRSQIALLRAVNARLGHRLDRADQLRVVKRGYAEGVLARQPGERPQAPAGLADVLGPATDAMLARVSAAGWRVHGPVGDLAPVLAAPGAPPPDADPPPGSRPRRIARDLLREGRAVQVSPDIRGGFGRSTQQELVDEL